MKKTIFNIALALVIGFTATANDPVDDERKQVNVNASNVTWKGYKVTGSHTGTIKLKSGYLEMEGDKLTGGEFVMDMTTIDNTDMEGGPKHKLENHLKSDDFFGVEKYPTAKLVFKSVSPMKMNNNSYSVTGDLTIKETTKPITFVVTVMGNTATATMEVDRAEYDVRYGSDSFFENLGDKAIYDNFDIVVNMVL